MIFDLEQSDEPDDFDSDAGGWSPRSPKQQNTTSSSRSRTGADITSNKRIRHDLSIAKEAGFRVSHLGSLFNGGRDGFVLISCRVAKLGISDEALQAWHLERSQYFLMIIRYTEGYKSLDALLASGTSQASGLKLRVGLSTRYKIALDEAIAAFTQLEDKSKSRKLVIHDDSTELNADALGRVFIGRPLDELINERLVPLLRYRNAMDLPWGGAEDFFSDHQGRNLTQEDSIPDKYWAPEETFLTKSLPRLVTEDHLADKAKEKSFPLLAMQFALRHLVRCTEFCLVCHCRVEADFEALKPYVCSKPLCLYQYMSLGFGPSIEHEIMTQPHVVDLLISFCYTAATNRKLVHLPTGMALMVPPPYTAQDESGDSPFPPMTGQPYGMVDGIGQRGTVEKIQKKAQVTNTYKCKFDNPKMELIFPSGTDRMLYPGNWIAFNLKDQRYHCRVMEVMFPTVRLGRPVCRQLAKGGKITQPTTISVSHSQRSSHLSNTNIANFPSTITPAATPPPTTDLMPSQLPEISFVIYDQNFDDLSDDGKARSICMMLDNLPSVQQMGDFLRSKGGQDVSLRSWADRISPAALGVLRWIIASNRSCIIQIDSIDGSSRKSEERVSGMSGWMQFRFAQGAPDKEQRFVTSIRDTTRQQKYPTMFAWHGSPLHNWHGIVREGLHFKKADHGRAYGDGCYHSLDANTSLGYSGGMFYGQGNRIDDDGVAYGQWPQSQLRISQAIALNEIVNAPTQFQSRTPHLVVAQLDWIQSRYLFVKCSIQGMQTLDSVPSQTYEQDPQFSPRGDQGLPVIIPFTAVSKSRRPVPKEIKHGNKKVKVDIVQDAEEANLLSDETDIEDVTILFSDTEEPQVISSLICKGKNTTAPELPTQPMTSETDFQPGTLDHKNLPLLQPPSYATSMATKALQRELTATLKVQDTHPLHELGWYIDRELINNVYQWIVELHTFESHLPLAKDMKSKNIKSVVLEIRFGKEYPMSPPFVRVIRPRFLSFLQGGGGHVTAGGALCMELLTNSGWSAVSNIESVLLQVRLAMSSTDPKPARLEVGPVRDYQVGEAVEAFVRACNAHGVSLDIYTV